MTEQKYKGYIGLYNLSEWYESLDQSEKSLLKKEVGKKDLINNEHDGDGETMGSWLNTVATNLGSKNIDFSIKLLTKALEEKDMDDVYFTCGHLSKYFYRKKDYQTALSYAVKQLELYKQTYKDSSFFNKLQFLPKAINGLDVVISIYKKEKRYEDAIAIAKEYMPLLDLENTYAKEVEKLKERILKKSTTT